MSQYSHANAGFGRRNLVRLPNRIQKKIAEEIFERICKAACRRFSKEVFAEIFEGFDPLIFTRITESFSILIHGMYF